MTADLFSSLDGCQSMWTWLVPVFVFILFLVGGTSIFGVNSTTMSFLSFSTLTESKKGFLPLPLFLFWLILMLVSLNILGMVPYVYGITSSLWAAGSMALMMWSLLIFSGWTHNPKESAAHLVPSGAPVALISFLVLVETVSVLIRPLTLTVRLIANISAGHIVLSLIANCLCGIGLFSGLMVLLVSVGYNLFEVFVCFVQAYIFTLLVSLYAQEHP